MSSNLQIFQVPGMGLMAAMAHRSEAFGSAVYLWTQSGFKLYQNITTHEALVWRHFNIGKKVWRNLIKKHWRCDFIVAIIFELPSALSCF